MLPILRLDHSRLRFDHNLVVYIHKWRTELETVISSTNQSVVPSSLFTQSEHSKYQGEPISEVRTFENIPQGAPKVGHPKM